MKPVNTLVIAATLALAPASAALAYPPRHDHPEVGPAGADKAAPLSPADAADHAVRSLLGDAGGHTPPTIPLRPVATPVRLR